MNKYLIMIKLILKIVAKLWVVNSVRTKNRKQQKQARKQIISMTNKQINKK